TAKSAIHKLVPWKTHLSRLDPPNRPPAEPILWVGRCQTACKPGSVPPLGAIPRGGDGHSSGTPVTERLMRPTRAAARRPARQHRIAPRCLPLLLGLAPGGVFPAAAVAGGAVRSYRTVSPLPPARLAGQAGGVLSVALSLGSPPPGVTRHRTSVEPGLSSPHLSAKSGHPAVWQQEIWVVAAPLSKPEAAVLRQRGAAHGT